MDNPPSATSSPQQAVQEEGVVESAPLPTPTPTPAPAAPTPTQELLEIPPPIRQLMRGFTDRSTPESSSGENRREGMPYYLGAFLGISLEWRAQAKSKADEARTLQTLQQEVATLKEEKESLCRGWACQEEVYKASLKRAQEANEEDRKRLHGAGQASAELLNQVAYLQSKIADLEMAVKNFEAQQKQLADQCLDREQSLEKTKGELTAKMEALSLLQTEDGKFQAELNRLQVEKEVLEKQLASEDSTIEELEKAKKELIVEKEIRDSTIEKLEEPKKKLINDMADTFAEGFKEDLSQAACENPGIDTSNCNPFNHIVDGKVVPLDLGE